MIISFTGTRYGMTPAQLYGVRVLIAELWNEIDMVVHGDCRGADTEFHNMILVLKGGFLSNNPKPKIRLRPSNLETTRAHNDYFDECLPPRDPLERNIDIVNDGHKLIATPREANPQSRGGTWHAVNYARRINKVVMLIDPDGRLR